jgi:translocation and assembly module TamB
MTADADRSGLKAAIGLTMESRGTQVALLDAKVAIPHLVVGRDSLGGQPIDGNLDIDSADIGPLVELIYPGLDGVGGVLSIHVTPRGTAGDFRLVGRLAREEARADFGSGLRLRAVSASLDADGSGQVSFDGSATSGGGHVKLEARSVRSQNGWINGTFNVSGERFQVINQPEAQVFISPNLDLLLEESNATLTGDVTVPYAKLEIAEVPPSAVSQSSDVVFLEDSLATRQRFNARATVRVALGDSVSFSGFGLRARLAGSLTLEDERGRPTRGSGEIRLVDGIYRAYGSELKIDPGRLVFGGGPIDNPGLDIRAYRNVSSQNVMEGAGDIVGMNIGGTLLKPEISLFSRPPMSESETLSYLMFGRPLSSGSEEDQTALASAALLLGMQRGSKLTGDIGKQFALDEAYIESGSAYNEASFVAGKYLSPKLFVSYATGFFEHTNSFRVHSPRRPARRPAASKSSQPPRAGADCAHAPYWPAVRSPPSSVLSAIAHGLRHRQLRWHGGPLPVDGRGAPEAVDGAAPAAHGPGRLEPLRHALGLRPQPALHRRAPAAGVPRHRRRGCTLFSGCRVR